MYMQSCNNEGGQKKRRNAKMQGEGVNSLIVELLHRVHFGSIHRSISSVSRAIPVIDLRVRVAGVQPVCLFAP